jgi:hypothetical protein
MAGASGPARPIPTWSPRVVRLSYASCGSARKRGLRVVLPSLRLLTVTAPAFRLNLKSPSADFGAPAPGSSAGPGLRVARGQPVGPVPQCQLPRRGSPRAAGRTRTRPGPGPPPMRRGSTCNPRPAAAAGTALDLARSKLYFLITSTNGKLLSTTFGCTMLFSRCA